jgi:hypothetical protein
VRRGNLRLLLSGPASSAGRPMPDGRRPQAGGWNRIHLIVADIDAEVARLEGLGAKRLEKVKTWWVMEAPTGQRFCVVRVATKDFAQNSNQWPDRA